MAISVMAFHYVSWSVSEPGSNSLLGKLGIYAVSIFYILSGLSLSYLYISVGKSFSLKEFIIKRVFRIVPIFWVCLTLVLILRYLKGAFIIGENFTPDLLEVFLNFSLLFGFFMPDKYFSVGAWSIGNEVVFYTIYPFIIYSCVRFGKALSLIWLILSVSIAAYFSFFLIDNSLGINKNWSLYVHPLNQLFLFVSGICISVFFRPCNASNLSLNFKYFISLLILFVIFIYFPVGDRSIDLITGKERMILSLLSILIVLNVYILQVSITGLLATVLLFFGRCCYSIYLFHPIVALPLSFVLHEKLGLHIVLTYLLSACITLILSSFSYNKLEKPMMDIGKRLSKKVMTQDESESNSIPTEGKV